MFTRCIKFMIMTPTELMIPFWGQQAFLVFGARGRHYESAGRWKDMFSAVFDLFSGENNTYFEHFFEADFRISSNIDFFTERFPFTLAPLNRLGGAIPTSPSLSPMASETGSPTVAQPDEPSSTRLGHVARWCIKEASGKVMRWIEVSQKIMFQTEVCLRLSPFLFLYRQWVQTCFTFIPIIWRRRNLINMEYFTVNMYTYIYLHMFWWFWCEWLNHHLVTLEIWRLKDQSVDSSIQPLTSPKKWCLTLPRRTGNYPRNEMYIPVVRNHGLNITPWKINMLNPKKIKV